MPGVPTNIKIPYFGATISPGRSGDKVGKLPIHMLVLGQRLSTGTVDALTLFTAYSAAEVGVKAGYGSMLHRMGKYIFPENNSVPVTFLGIDDGAGTQATRVVTIAGTSATEAGSLPLYVAGTRYEIPVAVGDTPTVCADAFEVLIDADVELQATMDNAAGVMTFTTRNDGIAAGDLDIRVEYNPGDKVPAGLTVAVGALTPGTVDPDLSTALAVLGETWFNIIINPYTDETSMTALEVYLDTADGPLVQKDALAYQCVRDTQANMVTYGLVSTRNSKSMVVLPGYGRMESTYEVAANVAAMSAVSLQEKLATPLHRMTSRALRPIAPEDRWTMLERNQLVLSGVSTLSDTLGVQTEGTVTMYLKNEAAAPDDTFAQQNKVVQSMYCRYSWVNWLKTKYPRAMQTGNSAPAEGGVQIMSNDIAETEAIAWFIAMQREHVVEQGPEVLAQFKAALTAARSQSDSSRVDWYFPINLMDQFIVGSSDFGLVG